MNIIKKKAWPELFEKVRTGEKNFDLRLNDFNCASGDILILEEWDPKTEKYTGRKLKRKISFVLKTKEIEKFWSKKEIVKRGYVVMGLKKRT